MKLLGKIDVLKGFWVKRNAFGLKMVLFENIDLQSV